MSTNKARWHHAAALLAICWVLVVAGCGETVSSSNTDLIDAEALDQSVKTKQAIAVAREVLQSAPDNIDAKDMLWRLYLSQLNEL